MELHDSKNEIQDILSMAFDKDNIHINTFSGGLDTDTAYPNLNNTKYFAANNVSLIGDNKFTTLQNIKGTTKLADITGVTNTDVLGVFESNYIIGTTENVKCLTIMTATLGGNFNIYAYDLNNNVLYSIYQEATISDYHTDDRVIDGVIFAERGFDILYFTDNYNQPRKLKCVIPSVYTPNFLLVGSLNILRPRAVGRISLDNVTTGGTLLTGTYQVAYQLINIPENRYSAFSLLTNPIHVYTKIANLFDNDNFVSAGVGLQSTKKIVVTVIPTEDELLNYTHYRLAIVENVNAEGVVDLNVDLSNITPIGSLTYEIKTNAAFNKTTIDEITIDLAAIEKIKTITISQNRLIFGNITTVNLVNDRGATTISGGNLVNQSLGTDPFTGVNDSFASDLFTSRYKGLFRGEVYRYAIAYYDKYGNFSAPVALDLSSITDNQITGGLKDLKIPKRWQAGGQYTVLNSSNVTQSIGLTINNINNHPSWAKGFVILRAKRLKDIVFQSPFLPLRSVFAPGNLNFFPYGFAYDRSTVSNPTYISYQRIGTGESGATPNANGATKPPGPLDVYVEPNLFSGGHNDIIKYSEVLQLGGTDLNKLPGSAIPNFGLPDMFMCFPDAVMYTNNSKTELTGNETITTIDSCTTRLLFKRFDPVLTKYGTSYHYGRSEASSFMGSFFASRNNDYYYHNGNTKGSGLETFRTNQLGKVNGYKLFDNFNEGTQLNGKNVFTHDKLEVQSIQWGFKPNVQRCMVIGLNNQIPDLANTAVLDVSLTVNYNSGVPIAQPRITTTKNSVNFDIPDQNFFGANNGSTSFGSILQELSGVINKIELVNITRDLLDDRYGDPKNVIEYIYTGTQVVFTNAETTTLKTSGNIPKTVTVWGGDCIVSPHTFKVSDSVYTIGTELKLIGGETRYRDIPDESVKRFGKAWAINETDPAPAIPIAVKNAAQYLSVVLESEFHGSVRDTELIDCIGNYNLPIKGAFTEGKLRAPFSYRYNTLSQQNDQKIFVPVDQLQPVVTKFPARIIYSNQKIYQTSIDGFDSFPVGNIYDLEERWGALTKLAFSNNNIYALQLNGVVYIPLLERILELTNTSQIGIRTGELFGNYIYLKTFAGCQHLRSVKSTGDNLFFADQDNKTVYSLRGSELKEITPPIWSLLKQNLTAEIAEKNLVGTYDYLRKEYWLNNKSGSFCLVYNDQFNSWVSNLTFTSGFSGGTYTNNNLYLIGNNAGNYALETMYTNATTQLFGNYPADISVSFVANPSPIVGKTFDDFLVNTSDKLATVDFNVQRDIALGNQSSSGIVLDVTSRGEGNYRAKVLRDSANARLRGLYSTIKLNWRTGVGTPIVNLHSALTKFRPSENLF